MPRSLPRRTAIALAILALAAPAARAAGQGTQPTHPLAALSFMAGCWRGDAGTDKTIEEQWTAADSDVMLGMTRWLDDHSGQTRGWEFSRVAVDSAAVVLFPAPRGEQQGRFRLTQGAAGAATFEDPAHDVPKRILYRRIDPRHLAIRIDNGASDREAREWRLESVACAAPGR